MDLTNMQLHFHLTKLFRLSNFNQAPSGTASGAVHRARLRDAFVLVRHNAAALPDSQHACSLNKQSAACAGPPPHIGWGAVTAALQLHGQDLI